MPLVVKKMQLENYSVGILSNAWVNSPRSGRHCAHYSEQTRFLGGRQAGPAGGPLSTLRAGEVWEFPEVLLLLLLIIACCVPHVAFVAPYC